MLAAQSLRAQAVRPFGVARCRPFSVVAARPTVESVSSSLSGIQVGQKSAVCGVQLVGADSGAQWYMMRHGNRVKHLGRPEDQRKALIRALVTEVLRHGQIRTTKVKAKVIKRYVDRMITLAKRGDLHARRLAGSFIYDDTVVANMFKQAPERYAERQGGYTRIKPDINLRRGDATEMAVIELV